MFFRTSYNKPALCVLLNTLQSKLDQLKVMMQIMLTQISSLIYLLENHFSLMKTLQF